MFSVQTINNLAIFMVVLVLSLEALESGDWHAAPTPLKNGLRIGAFNIRAFGQNKMKNTTVAEQLKKIVERYDVLLIQEIRDKCEIAVRKLLDMLELPFNFVISDRIGRTASKEQYAFFYRTDRVLIHGKFQYQDPQDVFEREPFVLKIAPEFASHDTVSLIGLHSKPSDATAEIGHLNDVISVTLETLGPDTEPIVLGDLNAGCTYSNLKKRQKANDYLTVNTESFTWLIGEDADTTTKASTNCAYDRIIVRADHKSHAVRNTAQVFNFQKWLRLTEEEALQVSDHFPVEVDLRFTL